MPWVVLKFGGTSVTSEANWRTIAGVLRARLAEGVRPVVVCSAFSRVSDALVRLSAELAAGRDGADELAFLRTRHVEQASALGLEPEEHLGELLGDLDRLAQGARLVGEVSPRLHARILSAGELMSTRLGAAWLSREGITSTWQDARSLLQAVSEEASDRRYASAQVAFDPRPELMDLFESLDGVVVTQGFIARDPQGDTVLLGRGGSDTSAATLAAQLQASRLEIWTDVSGMFTADPRQVPEARLLRQLDYDEAQELATMGAKVLHPRCLPPVRAHGIPLHIKCTPAPDMEGTVISAEASSGRPQVKALSARKGIVLVSMDTVGMWQQVGFLARVFELFARHHLSVDLVATSETNVTVSLDPSANTLENDRLDALLADLSAVCTPRLILPAASVSLVGRRIRAILHRLGGAMERFEDRHVHMMSQAASDLNLTFVVDEQDAAPLLRDLHAQLFKETTDPVFGPSWEQLFAGEALDAPLEGWWDRHADRLLAEAELGTPAYVYAASVLDERANQLVSLNNVDQVWYAVKANPHPDVLRRLVACGVGLECVSPGELAHVAQVAPAAPVLFTPNFAPAAEYEAGFAAGSRVTLDSIYPLTAWPSVFKGREVLVRLDPGRGGGHHRHVVTAGARSKFGVPPEELDELERLTRELGVRVVGLHAHAGSGMKVPTRWRDLAVFLGEVSARFPDVTALDVGGGLPVPERAGQKPFDLAAFDHGLGEVRKAWPGVELWIEPGRFLVSEAGVLLTRVSQVKSKGERHYVGVDAGMNTLVRPALYGARHEILNLSKRNDSGQMIADVVGPICETGDVLGHARVLPDTCEGDVLLVANAGAYGAAMSSDYNLRPRAREAVIDV
ncbi:MAG: bifunctional aspartate kinase/diaminopimelate decarboxylase [Proteobacteria bacterium]|nr:bifunctional aspartate kinase/diaminopimelate decarboxylase [Pseudomonadota bacterium]